MAYKEEFYWKSFLVLFVIFIVDTVIPVQSTYVAHLEIGNDFSDMSKEVAHRINRRDASGQDAKCSQQAKKFLADLKTTKVDKQHTFENETKDKLAMAWAGQNDGILIAVTSSQNMFGQTEESTVYRSDDFGASFIDITNLVNVTKTIKVSHGVQRNPHDPKKVYLVGDGNWIYITEDGGLSFKYYDMPFTIADEISFHNTPSLDSHLLAKSSSRNLYLSTDNGITWKQIRKNVDTVFWGIPGNKESQEDQDNDQTIYISEGDAQTDPILQHFLQMTDPTYTLSKTTDNGDNWTGILSNVVSFERRGKYLYASTETETATVIKNRKLQFSVDNGNTWMEARLPAIDSDQFYQVMDIEDNMVFMHVDNKADTGHGTLYTSAGDGVIYSESLPRHLYPNYGSIHDFYKVKSMRGVYITSQMGEDNSIHSMITFNRGAEWQKIPRPEGVPCKDETKECFLQVHGMYSVKRNLHAMPPMSEETAKGIILVHGHVADALQKTDPDVYVSSDGGYTWRKALTGPHLYQIGDHGGLLVAVSKSEPNPKVIKFSLDEGRCWHEYTFTNKTLNITGLLTEPEGKSAVVMIWGYVAATKRWEVHVVDFKNVINRQCGDDDYEPWVEHAMHGSDTDTSLKGCLLGQKRTFERLIKDSWCYNGYSHEQESTSEICKCTVDDYECDYGYFRPGGSQNCVEIPQFKGGEIDICLRGHEEKEISEGYRKIPGDVCSGGFSPRSRVIDLNEACGQGQLSKSKQPVNISKGVKVVAVIIVIVILALAAFMGVYFMHKFMLLRRNKTEYRYSLLQQGEGAPPKPTSSDDQEDELDRGLSSSLSKYLDSDDEELTTRVLPPSRRPVHAQNGSVKPKATKPSTQKDTNPFTSYHDDSDDDLLS